MEAGEKPGNEGITVITTNVSADFDAIASMLAAQKIYPGFLFAMLACKRVICSLRA